MRRRAAALYLLAALLASPASADEASPRAVVEKLHAALVQVAARAASLGQGGRARALETVVRDTHAPELTAADRLPSNWSGLDAGQRAALADLTARLTAAAYAEEFDESERVSFATAAVTADGAGATFVAAVRTGRDGERHPLRYELRWTGSAWRIVNRTEDGEDLLPEQRATWEALWARGGFPALVAGLEALLHRGAPPAPAATATQVVARLQDALLAVMREAKQLGYAGRYRRLEPVIRETHYLAAIARLTVRRHWDGWSPAQQKEFADTFARLSVANYASKFDGYSGERFARVEEKQVGKSTVVRSVLTKSNGEVIRFDYTLRRLKGRWRILNITVDGVSDLSTKQAEYGSVLSSGGLPALLGKLREQIRRYESGS